MSPQLLLALAQFCTLVGNSLSYRTGADCFVNVRQCILNLDSPNENNEHISQCMVDFIQTGKPVVPKK